MVLTSAPGRDLPALARSAANPPKDLPASDWQSIRAAHTAWRHAVRPLEGTTERWQARNPGQQWTTSFDARGFETAPQGASWRWGLELRRFGLAGAERAMPAKAAAVVADGQRISYRWDDVLQEWFVNDGRGLEHGFSVQTRPPGAGGAPLRFELAVRGTLVAAVAADAQSVHFRDAPGAPVVHYAGLKVWDADGRILPAHFEAGADGGIVLSVDERGARYPLTVDPVAQQAYLKPSPAGATQAGDFFGFAVGVSGDTVIVGAPLEDSSSTGVNSVPNESATTAGAAYIFVRSGGTWTQQAYLKAPFGSSLVGDQFGFSVAISGDTAVVGSRWEDGSATGVNGPLNDSALDAGAVYVFVRSGSTWTQQAYLKPAAVGTTQAGDWFGFSVAIAGDTLVVGAIGEDSSSTGVNSLPNEAAPDAGAAYVFVRSGVVWSQQAYLKPAAVGTSQAGDNFGYAVSISGDSIIVGAPLEDSNATGVNAPPDDANGTIFESGTAYVFTRSGVTWTQQATLKPAQFGAFQQGDTFGASVSIAGDTAVVGAPGEDSSSLGVSSTPNENGANAGAAFVFVRNAGVWTQQAYLKPAAVGSSQSGDNFGTSVVVAGDTVVVGAPYENSSTTGINSTPDGNSSDAGAVYVFVRSGSVWSQQAYLKPGSIGTSQSGDAFGYAVALSADTLIVGAPTEDSNATGVNGSPDENAVNAGAATVFLRSGATWTQQAFLKPAVPSNGLIQAGDRFGAAVAISGDTVAVGAPSEDSGTTGVNSSANDAVANAGAVYIFVRSGGTWMQQAYLKPAAFGTTQFEDFFGSSLGLSGDTLIVGAPFEDSSTTGVNSSADEAATQSGAAYIFVRSGGVWSQQAYLKPGGLATINWTGLAKGFGGVFEDGQAAALAWKTEAGVLYFRELWGRILL